MSKKTITTLYHRDADHATVDRLVGEHAAMLMAGVDVNRVHTGVGKAIILQDSYFLSCVDRARAKEESLDIETDYAIVGFPEKSELGDYLKKHLAGAPKMDL